MKYNRSLYSHTAPMRDGYFNIYHDKLQHAYIVGTRCNSPANAIIRMLDSKDADFRPIYRIKVTRKCT